MTPPVTAIRRERRLVDVMAYLALNWFVLLTSRLFPANGPAVPNPMEAPQSSVQSGWSG